MRCILPLLLLAGCSPKERPPLMIPVATSCVTGEIPSPPPAMKPLTGHAQEDLVTITAQALRWRIYAAELEAILEGCR